MHSASSKFPVEMNVSLGENDQPYPAGKYEIAESSFQINQYGSLELSKYNLKLVPVAEDKK